LLGSTDAFVARLNSDLTQILQSTYLGGRYIEIAYALAIHPKTGEVYVAGATNSADFPKTDGGAQEKCSSCSRLVPLLGKADAFVARLNKELTQILQSTYLGEKAEDDARALAIHFRTGEVYVAGSTTSRDFPRTTGGAQAAHGGGLVDAFVTRLNEELTQILQSTYLGGGGNDEIYALAVHPTTGEVYMVGKTESTNFPNTTGGGQATDGGGTDAFVARLSADLSAGKKSADGGFYTTSSAMASAWNILLLLSVPAFVVARRIRKI
jgi:muconolactone delta-isomerase